MPTVCRAGVQVCAWCALVFLLSDLWVAVLAQAIEQSRKCKIIYYYTLCDSLCPGNSIRFFGSKPLAVHPFNVVLPSTTNDRRTSPIWNRLTASPLNLTRSSVTFLFTIVNYYYDRQSTNRWRTNVRKNKEHNHHRCFHNGWWTVCWINKRIARWLRDQARRSRQPIIVCTYVDTAKQK